MRIPLVINWNPRDASIGPRVRLTTGRWKFTQSNGSSSIVHIIHSGQETLLSLAEVDGPIEVFSKVVEVGKETKLTIFAERIPNESNFRQSQKLSA